MFGNVLGLILVLVLCTSRLIVDVVTKTFIITVITLVILYYTVPRDVRYRVITPVMTLFCVIENVTVSVMYFSTCSVECIQELDIYLWEYVWLLQLVVYVWLLHDTKTQSNTKIMYGYVATMDVVNFIVISYFILVLVMTWKVGVYTRSVLAVCLCISYCIRVTVLRMYRRCKKG